MSKQHKKLGIVPTRKREQANSLIVAQDAQPGFVSQSRNKARRPAQRHNRRAKYTTTALVDDLQRLQGELDAYRHLRDTRDTDQVVLGTVIEKEEIKPRELVQIDTSVNLPDTCEVMYKTEYGYADGPTLRWNIPTGTRLSKMLDYNSVVEDITITKTKWWKPWYKRSYTSSNLVNHDHEGLDNCKIPDHIINEPLYIYLRTNKQPQYPNRDLKVLHLHRLKLKYYEVSNIEVPKLSIHQVNCDTLTVGRAADERDEEFLLKETNVYTKRGFRNALSNRFGSRITIQ